MSIAAPRHRFSADDYFRMIDAGVFRDDDRVELLDGEISEMTPIGSLHAAVVDRLARIFFSRLGTRAIVRVQGPVPSGSRSVPQPDLALLRDVADFYASTPLGPDSVFLLVEGADTSVGDDRAKRRIYGAAGVAEVWLVNLPGGIVEMHRGPADEGDRQTQVVHRGETIAPAAFPDLVVTVDDILG